MARKPKNPDSGFTGPGVASVRIKSIDTLAADEGDITT
jgi:hypothetical protein